MSKTEKELRAELEDEYKIEPNYNLSINGVDHLNAYNKCIKIVQDRGDGGSTNYYKLPEGASELRHLIKHKKMEHGIGEAFCALYRLNDNGEYLRNLKKAKFYIDAEIESEENK